jgi:hypothetical protein
MAILANQNTAVNTAVLPQAFSEALQADLSAQYDRMQLESVSSDGTTPPGHSAIASSPWMTLGVAVRVLTRQMRMHGYLPEKVLVAIKSAVCDAAVPLVSNEVVARVVQEASQTSISAYFEPEIESRELPASAARVSVPTGVETPGSIRPSISLEHHF